MSPSAGRQRGSLRGEAEPLHDDLDLLPVRRWRAPEEPEVESHVLAAWLRDVRADGRPSVAPAVGRDARLGNVPVAAALKEARVKLADKAQVDATRVLAELGAVAFSDVGEILDFRPE